MAKTVIILLIILINTIKCSNINQNIYKYIQNNEFINKTAKLSSKCDDFFSIWNFIFNKDNIRLKRIRMMDASSKLQSGLEDLNFYALGDFDECYSTEDEFDGTPYYGKYCFGSISTISFKNQTPKTLGTASNFGFHFAQCLPSFCTVEDFQSRFSLMTFREGDCYSKATKPDLDAGAIATITILAIFLGIVTISTIYDFILEYKNKKSAHPILVAFSFLTNWRKIFKTNNKEQLACLSGIRALSMMWIILYHEYLFLALNTAVSNFLDVYKYLKTMESLTVIQGSMAVDSFFAVGGLVLVYSFLRAAEKGRKYNVGMSYVHRYFRLTPVVAIMILIHAFLLTHLGNGPLWNNLDYNLINNCRTHWWTAILYIQNYINPTENCVPQSWYLSIDMQLFVLSPILLIPLRKWPKYTLVVMVGLIAGGIAVPFTLSYIHELPASVTFLNPEMDKYNKIVYMQTYCRFGAYVIGMLTGYFVYKLKKRPTKIRLSWIVVLVVWLGILGTLLACIYGPTNDLKHPKASNLSHAFYNGFSRTAWAAAVSAMSLMCIAGYGGPVNILLSHSIFQIMGKLSYCMYIVHYSLIFLRISSLRTETYFNNYLMMFNYGGDMVLTLVISVIYCMTFELPFIIVEKYCVNFVQNLVHCRLSFEDVEEAKPKEVVA